jgi:hypothetical protein
MVIIADMSRARESATALKDRFRKEGERLGVRIYPHREHHFNAMHRKSKHSHEHNQREKPKALPAEN